MTKPSFFVLLFFLFCQPIIAQQKSTASATVDKESILIGEPFQLTLEAGFSKPHIPALLAPDSLPHFEILNRSQSDTQTINSQTVLRQVLTLTSWDSGAWVIPALPVTTVKGLATKPIVVQVMFTPMPANQEYHDIRDIIDVQKPQRTTWYWYLVGAVLLLLLLLLIFPKKKKEVVVNPVVIREGAYKKALNEIELLKSKNVGSDKEYFTELIGIFRTYLQQGKGIHSFQQTTGDLSRQLQPLQMPHEDFKKLVQALQLGDYVKFAQYTATEREREAATEEIKNSIIAIEPLKT